MLPALGSPLHQNVRANPAFFADLNLENFNKPLVVAMYGNARDRLIEELKSVPGIACYCSVEQAAHALGQLYRYHQALLRPLENWVSLESAAPPKYPAKPLMLGQEAMDFLAAQKIPSLSGHLTHTVNQAVVAAASVGYPVVLKIISAEYIHKSDQGGVILNLRDEDELIAAFARLQPLLAAEPYNADAGILVQKQLQGRELLLGLKQDPTFGPVIVCGYGGTLTELWQDTAQTLAPLSPAQAHDLLTSLRSYPLLTGYRGEPAADLKAVIQAIVNLGKLGMSHPHLQELDINPLIATPEGCWAVDARLIWQKRANRVK
jgi:acetate---CoA ligase (ADP-forming)